MVCTSWQHYKSVTEKLERATRAKLSIFRQNHLCRFGAAGCDGGSDDAAYEWMMKYGLPTEEEYGSYESKVGNMKKGLSNIHIWMVLT